MGAGNPESDADTTMLRLADIRKSYTTGPIVTEVLRGVTLDVRKGDLVSIVGTSGSGKSTLVNIIGLLDQPSSGAYFLKGREIGAISDDELSALRNQSIGFIFQSFNLLSRLTALENVAAPLIYRSESSAVMLSRAREMLEMVGLDERMGHRPSELSGGQRQRVAIARALIGTPDILLADEPTGALDAKTGDEIMELLEKLNAEHHLTAIIITHDHSVARRCRRRFRMHNGVLTETVQAQRAKRKSASTG